MNDNLEKQTMKKQPPANFVPFTVNGGPGRVKGVPNKYSRFKDELFDVLKRNKVEFAERIEGIIRDGSNSDVLSLCRVYADLSPKEAVLSSEGGGPAIVFQFVKQERQEIIEVKQDKP